MTAWKTNFSLEELLDWKNSTKDPDLCARIDEMVKCLGMCQSNTILVTVMRGNPS